LPTTKLRGLRAEDAIWASEVGNDSEAARAYIPETSTKIIGTLERLGYRHSGAMKNYCFINDNYVDIVIYNYP
jgi:hypothetical protein